MWILQPSVTTRLVVLSNRLQFWKNWQKRRTPRRNVMGTTDRRGGLVPKYLENLKLGTENQLSELCDGMAGRTITGVTDRHRPLVEIWVSELCDDLQDGSSQARRAVTCCVNPSLSRNSSIVLRDVFDYSCFNYKVSGLMLISLIT